MKFAQEIEHGKIFFFKNHAENETERLVPDPLTFKKALYEVKGSGPQLTFNYRLSESSTWYTIKTSCMKHLNIDPQICCSILIF